MAREIRIHLEMDLKNRTLPLETQLNSTDSHHLKNVLRLKAKETFWIFDGNGAKYLAVLLSHKGKQSRIKVLEQDFSETDQGPCSPFTIVYQAIPKGAKIDGIIRPLSELGLNVFSPLICERSVVFPEEKGWKKRLTRWQRIARESAKQSGRKIPMIIGEVLSFSNALEKIQELDHGLILLPPKQHQNSSPTFWGKISGRKEEKMNLRLGLLIGPEGGFSPKELEMAKESRWQAISLNPNILRCETASIAAMAIIQYMVFFQRSMVSGSEPGSTFSQDKL